MNPSRGLTGFMLARIAADEEAERVALSGDRVVGSVDPAISDEWHWVKRGRREREAKRRIVEHHGAGESECGAYWWGEGDCQTMRLLALPYADHPDYRDEWKP